MLDLDNEDYSHPGYNAAYFRECMTFQRNILLSLSLSSAGSLVGLLFDPEIVGHIFLPFSSNCTELQPNRTRASVQQNVNSKGF
jgi:hypothetical protein